MKRKNKIKSTVNDLDIMSKLKIVDFIYFYFYFYFYLFYFLSLESEFSMILHMTITNCHIEHRTLQKIPE